jgi:hypothetical protein
MPYKNIKPDIWGPHLWRFLHYLSLSYPENPTDEEKEIMLNFLESLQEILPCEKCRYNFNKHLDNLDMKVLDNNINFIKWMFNIHNEVNRDTGKPILSYDDFIKMYSINHEQVIKKEMVKEEMVKEEMVKEENIKKEENNYNYYIIIGILIILILIICVHKYY